MRSYEINISVLEDSNDDLIQLSKLHKKLFDKEHFTSNFDENLLKIYFQMLLRKSDFSYKAVMNEKIIGYLIAGYHLDDVLKQFSKKYSFKILIILLKNPHFLLEKISDLIRKFIFKVQKSKAEMRLFLIASEHNEEIKGIGRKLITTFENDLHSKGISQYGLSVRKNNSKAIEFYRKLGFIEEFRTNKSIYFVKEIKNL